MITEHISNTDTRRRSSSIRRLLISDTTLRDGEQMPGGDLDIDDKVTIASALALAGIDSIEAGFPASSDQEARAVREVATGVRGPAISALCRANKADVDCAAEALDPSPPFKRVVSIFIATSRIHREFKLGLTQKQLIEKIVSTLSYAKTHFQHIVFSAEDATRTEPEFLAQVCKEAIAAGATVVCLPDTVGVMTPDAVSEMIETMRASVSNLSKARLAVHFHDDLGLATANTLAAVLAGVSVIQCTVNGIGERAGNAALEEVLLAMHVNGERYQVKSGVKLDHIFSLSALVSERIKIPIAPHKAVVGSNIFSSAAGIHQDGLLKDPATYLPFLPELIGAPGIRLILGKQSGRSAVEAELNRIGVEPTPEVTGSILRWLKRRTKADRENEASTIYDALDSLREGK